MAFDRWAQAIAVAVAHETDSIYGNADASDPSSRRASLERIRSLTQEGRRRLVEQPAPTDEGEIRRRVDFSRAVRRLGEYVDDKLEAFDADPSVGGLLARVQPLVSLWDDDYRDPALTDES